MAILKSTSVTGNLTVSGDIIGGSNLTVPGKLMHNNQDWFSRFDYVEHAINLTTNSYGILQYKDIKCYTNANSIIMTGQWSIAPNGTAYQGNVKYYGTISNFTCSKEISGNCGLSLSSTGRDIINCSMLKATIATTGAITFEGYVCNLDKTTNIWLECPGTIIAY